MRNNAQILSILMASMSLIGCHSMHKSSAQYNMADSRYRVFMKLADRMSNSDSSAQIHVYKQAMRDEPTNVNEAEYRVASLYRQRGEHMQAAQYYQASLNKQKTDKRARKGLINSYIALKQDKNALKQIDVSLQQDNNDTDSLNELAYILDSYGSHHIARECYRQGLMHKPRDLTLMNNIALSYLLDDKVEDSIKSMQAALFSYPREKRIINNLHIAEKGKELLGQYPGKRGHNYAHQYIVQRLHFKDQHDPIIFANAQKIAYQYCHVDGETPIASPQNTAAAPRQSVTNQPMPVSDPIEVQKPLRQEVKRPALIQTPVVEVTSQPESIKQAQTHDKPVRFSSAFQTRKQEKIVEKKQSDENNLLNTEFINSISRDYDRGTQQTQKQQIKSIGSIKVDKPIKEKQVQKVKTAQVVETKPIQPMVRPKHVSKQPVHGKQHEALARKSEPKKTVIQEANIGFILPSADALNQQPKPSVQLTQNKAIKPASASDAKPQIVLNAKHQRKTQIKHKSPQVTVVKRKKSIATLQRGKEFTLVLMSSAHQSAVKSYLQANQLNGAKFVISKRDNKLKYKIIYKTFKSKAEAYDALFGLPIEWQRYSPVVVDTTAL